MLHGMLWWGRPVLEFEFAQLDDGTRGFMLEELDRDLKAGTEFVGSRLNSEGHAAYLAALDAALRSGTPYSLQLALEPVPGRLWVPAIVDRRDRRSTTPRSAGRTLAEGEFNRYYMRAICRRAVAEGDGTVRVRRGKRVQVPRADPQVKVRPGDVLSAADVLEDLRLHPGADTRLGMPRGPNSGLTLEFLPTQDGPQGTS
jgi:hypothetical protein